MSCLCGPAGMGNPGAGSRGETAAGYRAALAQRLGVEIGPGPMFAIILRPGADQFADKEPFIASFQLVNLLERLRGNLQFIELAGDKVLRAAGHGGGVGCAADAKQASPDSRPSTIERALG